MRSHPEEFRDLFGLARYQDDIPWVPYKDSVEIFRLYGDGVTGPAAAFLRFCRGAEVPLHEHVGYEHILVLAGSRRDETGVYGTGHIAINPPGTRHKVISETGCIVLAIYEEIVGRENLSLNDREIDFDLVEPTGVLAETLPKTFLTASCCPSSPDAQSLSNSLSKFTLTKDIAYMRIATLARVCG